MDRKHQLRQKASDFLIVLAFIIFLILIGENQIWDINFINIIPWIVILSCLAFIKMGIIRHLKISDGEQKIYINDSYYSPIDIINFETFLQNNIFNK